MAVLSIRVPLRRLPKGIGFGHGEDRELEGRVRVFGNFIEYVPMILLLMALIELSKGAGGFLHTMGTLLIIARLIHAVSLKPGAIPKWRRLGRAIGAGTTWFLLIACAGYGLILQMA